MTETNGTCPKVEAIKAHFIDTYSDIKELFEGVATVELKIPSKQSTPSSIVQIVIMQMLSGKVADTIYSRVKELAAEKNCKDWDLSFEDYQSSGLSKTKAETIIRFAEYYRDNKSLVDNWPALGTDQLIKEITRHKGLGMWTASILALSHFGKEDVFPHQDGILKKAIGLIQNQYCITLDPEKARPYRSYLAHYLWKIMDKGLLNKAVDTQ